MLRGKLSVHGFLDLYADVKGVDCTGCGVDNCTGELEV